MHLYRHYKLWKLSVFSIILYSRLQVSHFFSSSMLLKNFFQTSKNLFLTFSHQYNRINFNQTTVEKKKSVLLLNNHYQNFATKKNEFSKFNGNSLLHFNQLTYSFSKNIINGKNKQTKTISQINSSSIQFSQQNKFFDAFKLLKSKDLKNMDKQSYQALLQRIRHEPSNIKICFKKYSSASLASRLRKLQQQIKCFKQSNPQLSPEECFNAYFRELLGLKSGERVDFLYPGQQITERIFGICHDGTITTATGRGAGSHHGGIYCWGCQKDLGNGEFQIVFENGANSIRSKFIQMRKSLFEVFILSH